ncbi:MAG: hypothetical protein HZA95_03035 [Candidatus Vogelbacteria bacterium]|nr:hypothetical protein [Candidatus Vogelbacteria bacterium]
MKNITKSFGVGFVVLSLLASRANAQIGTKLNAETGVSGSVNALVNTKVNTDVDGEFKANVNKSPNAEVGAEGTSEESESAIRSEAQVGTDAEIKLKVNASGIAITSSSEVATDEDLKVFSSNIKSKNKAVVSVEENSADSSPVKIVYKHTGKLLWLIPVTIESTTVIEAKSDTEAEVRSSLPWWGFLVAGENYNSAALEARIRNNERIMANAKVNANARAKAEIAEAVIAELNASANSETSASVE